MIHFLNMKKWLLICAGAALLGAAGIVSFEAYQKQLVQRELVRLKQGDPTGKDDAAAIDAAATLARFGGRAVPSLEKLLADDNDAVRRRAALSLSWLGRAANEATPALIKSLQDTDALVRSRAAYALGDIGAEAENAVPSLVDCLDDKEAAVRASAARALWLIEKHPRAIPTLIEVIEADAPWSDPYLDPNRILGDIGSAAKPAVPTLIERLVVHPRLWQGAHIAEYYAAVGGDGQVRLTHPAAKALVQIGVSSEEIPAILRVLKPDKQNWPTVCRLLRIVGPSRRERIPIHIDALKAKDPGGCVWAADFLITAGPEDKDIVPDLIEALKDENAEVRAWAAATLIKIGPEAKAAIPVLTEAQTDEDERVRWRAAMALDEVRKEVPQVAPRNDSLGIGLNVLIGALLLGAIILIARSVLRSQSRYRVKVLHLFAVMPMVAGGYVWFLTSIGQYPLPVGSRLFRLRFGNETIRSGAAHSLLRAGSAPVLSNTPEVLRGLKEGLFDESDYSMAVYYLQPGAFRRYAHGAPPEVVKLLVKMLSANEGIVRKDAATFLGHHGSKAKPSVPALAVALNDWSANRAAAVTLAKMGPEAKAAIAALEEATTDPDPAMSAFARYALWKIDPTNFPAEKAVPALIVLLTEGNHEYIEFPTHKAVAQDAISALSNLGPAATSAVPALMQALNDKDPGVRQLAAMALKRIDPAAAARAGVQ